MARLTLRLLLALSVLACALAAGSSPSAVTLALAQEAPAPGDIVLRLEDLPPGFSPVSGATAPSALPDGLARQAVAEFTNNVEGQPTTIRQTVLRFDGRDATEYQPRFRDLMVRHQGYALVAGGDESSFRLIRTRGDELSVMAGQASGDVLVMTTVTGPTGTVAREGLSLETAGTKVPYLGLPAVNGSRRWPMPTTNLPSAPTIDVIQPRARAPKDEPDLSILAPVPPAARNVNWPTDPGAYAQALPPLYNEFWTQVFASMNLKYEAPGFVLAREGELVLTGCGSRRRPVPAADALYCGRDRTVYVYEPFLRDELIAGQDWQDRAIVIATVLAHEWGHHIQTQLGVIDAGESMAEVEPEFAPLITRQQELEADCFAGLFVRYSRDRGWLQIGDVAQAQAAFERAGDFAFDSPGHHGTPDERKEWFMRGFVHYTLRSCETW